MFYSSTFFSAEGFAQAWSYKQMFIDGLICTVSLSLLTVIFGFILSLILTVMNMSKWQPFRFLALDKRGHLREQGVLAKISTFNPISFIASVYIEIIRATPMLLQLFMVYYVAFADIHLPSIKLFGTVRFERFVPGVVALSLNSAAYLSEILRSGIQSIDGGQTEAARSLGLTQTQNMRFIILPQAIKNILPAIANEFVTIIKESSICYTIGVGEIMYAVASIKGATYLMGQPLVIAAAVYFCLTFPTSKIIEYFERKMSAGDKR